MTAAPSTPPMAPDSPRRGARWWLVLAALVAAAAAVLLVVAISPGDDDHEDEPQASPTTTTLPGTTLTTTTTTVPVAGSALWPAPGTSTSFGSPADAARSFAVDFLHFRDPVVGTFLAGDSRSGEVPVRPAARGPVTTVLVRQLDADGTWSVLGATTPNIRLDSPDAGEEIASPVRVRGRALAFEGTVRVEVRTDGVTDAVGSGFVTGGGDELRPFEGMIRFDAGTARRGALVLFTQSARNGEVWEAMALRVGLAPAKDDTATCGGFRPSRPTTDATQMEVEVYFNCDADDDGVSPFAVHRAVPDSPAVLAASMAALLAGPTDEERAAGLGSFFSSATKDMLRSATLEGGHAVIDFADLRKEIPNASTSAGSALLLSQLDATAFQFSTVRSVEYRLLGSCEDFTEWLQFGGCAARTRAGGGGT